MRRKKVPNPVKVDRDAIRVYEKARKQRQGQYD
jgi:hypothetical protein